MQYNLLDKYKRIGCLTSFLIGIIIYKKYFRYITKQIKYIAIFILYLAFCFYLWNVKTLVGGGLIGFSILGGILYGYTKKRDLAIFRIFYLPGIIISIFSLFASNTGVNSMTMGFTICAIASVYFIFDL